MAGNQVEGNETCKYCCRSGYDCCKLVEREVPNDRYLSYSLVRTELVLLFGKDAPGSGPGVAHIWLLELLELSSLLWNRLLAMKFILRLLTCEKILE